MIPTRNVFSGSAASTRVFQNRSPSGSPSRSRGPGKSPRKNSASCSSKEQSPFGIILVEAGGPNRSADRAATDESVGVPLGVVVGESCRDEMNRIVAQPRVARGGNAASPRRSRARSSTARTPVSPVLSCRPARAREEPNRQSGRGTGLVVDDLRA